MVEAIITKPPIKDRSTVRRRAIAVPLRVTPEGFEKNGHYYVGEEAVRFFVEADRDGAFVRLRASGAIDPDAWDTTVGIVEDHLTTDASFAELSAKYGYKDPGAASARFIRFVRLAYANGSASFKRRFNLDEISFSKPRSERTRDRISSVRGGQRASIRRLVSSGVTDFHAAADELKMDHDSAKYAFRGLRRAGHVAESKIQENRRLAEKIPEAAGRIEIKNVLGQINYIFYRTHRDLFIPLKKLAKEAGYVFRAMDTREFARALERQGIPFGHLKPEDRRGPRDEYFILPQQRREVLIAFELAKWLDSFKSSRSVIQVSGAASMPDRIRDFSDRDKYVYFYEDLRNLGFTDEQLRKIIRSCPFRTYKKNSGGYLTRVEDFEAVIDWGKTVAKKLLGNRV